MDNLNDQQLESELQELYILAKHWSDDLDFLEKELSFFKNVHARYPDSLPEYPLDKNVVKLEKHLASLKTKIPAFLNFLKPFITGKNKAMDMGFLERYNLLRDELNELFTEVRMTKKELFTHTEALIMNHTDVPHS